MKFNVQQNQEFKIKITGYIEILDQYQYLGNCPPTPPLTQH